MRVQQSMCHMAGVISDLWLPSQLQSIAFATWPAEGRRLSWPDWLVRYQDSIQQIVNWTQCRVTSFM